VGRPHRPGRNFLRSARATGAYCRRLFFPLSPVVPAPVAGALGQFTVVQAPDSSQPERSCRRMNSKAAATSRAWLRRLPPSLVCRTPPTMPITVLYWRPFFRIPGRAVSGPAAFSLIYAAASNDFNRRVPARKSGAPFPALAAGSRQAAWFPFVDAQWPDRGLPRDLQRSHAWSKIYFSFSAGPNTANGFRRSRR